MLPAAKHGRRERLRTRGSGSQGSACSRLGPRLARPLGSRLLGSRLLASRLAGSGLPAPRLPAPRLPALGSLALGSQLSALGSPGLPLRHARSVTGAGDARMTLPAD